MDPEATLRWCREAIAEQDFALAGAFFVEEAKHGSYT
jgi:hypothetical protein